MRPLLVLLFAIAIFGSLYAYLAIAERPVKAAEFTDTQASGRFKVELTIPFDCGVSGFELDDSGEPELFDRIDVNREMRLLRLMVAERLSDIVRFSGQCAVTMPGNAFDRAGDLKKLHPPNPQTGRIRLEVPVSGLLDELTVKQSEELYKRGRRN